MLSIVLDTGPLGLITKRQGIPEADTCRQWLVACIRNGATILVPAIAYYEVRRELERVVNTTGIARLEAFCLAVEGRYLPLSDEALRHACLLWAQARNAGLPTADPKELDCDVFIAAQALTAGIATTDLIIATVNVGHLARFAPAELWGNIVP